MLLISQIHDEEWDRIAMCDEELEQYVEEGTVEEGRIRN